MSVKVRNVPTGTDSDGVAYAVKDDIETFFSCNSPNASPSNLFAYYRSCGQHLHGQLVGRLEQELITPLFDGVNSWFYIPLVIEKVN